MPKVPKMPKIVASLARRSACAVCRSVFIINDWNFCMQNQKSVG